jgi:hypothetical protein
VGYRPSDPLTTKELPLMRLTLRKESLADLTTDELTAVGGAGTTDVLTNTCVTIRCSGLTCLISDVVCLEP